MTSFEIAGTHSWSDCASTVTHSFVGMRLRDSRMPPAVEKRQEVLHLFRCSTHTHTFNSWGTWSCTHRILLWSCSSQTNLSVAHAKKQFEAVSPSPDMIRRESFCVTESWNRSSTKHIQNVEKINDLPYVFYFSYGQPWQWQKSYCCHDTTVESTYLTATTVLLSLPSGHIWSSNILMENPRYLRYKNLQEFPRRNSWTKPSRHASEDHRSCWWCHWHPWDPQGRLALILRCKKCKKSKKKHVWVSSHWPRHCICCLVVCKQIDLHTSLMYSNVLSHSKHFFRETVTGITIHPLMWCFSMVFLGFSYGFHGFPTVFPCFFPHGFPHGFSQQPGRSSSRARRWGFRRATPWGGKF